MRIFHVIVFAFLIACSAKAQEARTPECRADQLVMYHSFGGVGMGHEVEGVTARNRSARPCELRSLPRIRQFTSLGKELPGGFDGECLAEPDSSCSVLLNSGERAGFQVHTLNGTGFDENSVCANKLLFDSPKGSRTWPPMEISPIFSCREITVDHFGKYQFSGVAFDAYGPSTAMAAHCPHGGGAGRWSLTLIDAMLAKGHHHRLPYLSGEDEPFDLILQSHNGAFVSPADNPWCDGGLTLVLHGPNGNVVHRTIRCDKQSSAEIRKLHPNTDWISLHIYLHEVGFDLNTLGEYRVRALWRLPRCSGASDDCSTSSDGPSLLVRSNEMGFTITARRTVPHN